MYVGLLKFYDGVKIKAENYRILSNTSHKEVKSIFKQENMPPYSAKLIIVHLVKKGFKDI